MTDVLDRDAFETMYVRQAPWDIGQPQEPFIDVAHRIGGSILDAGCGTGDTALFLAGRGHQVTGIDFLDEPIRRAKQKAIERGLSATFLVKDALTLKDWAERFDNVIDSGLFHVFSDDDREKYVAGLATVLKLGGFLFLMCWSDEEPGTDGPRRVSKKELHDTFAQGWVIESIQPCTSEARPTRAEFKDFPYRPKAWFAVVQRTA
jgi:cyclopropane fatty-acyl-phospholipid synthase-like methyltransferase